MFYINILLINTIFIYCVASRLSNIPNSDEFVPNANLEVLQGLDEKWYEELLMERPVLRQMLTRDRRSNSLRLKRGYGRASSPPSSSGAIYYTNSTANYRRFEFNLIGTSHWNMVYPYVISCFWCGMNDTLIPRSSVCHDAFDSDDSQARKMQRFLRARCYFYNVDKDYNRQFEATMEWPPNYTWKDDRGLKVDIFGPYIKSCFKRFVDVGPLYTARGCRSLHTSTRTYWRSFASHRLWKLEIVAKGHKDVCVHSPHASLTPFSRAISLFVRYHVCVCDSPYCNGSPPPTPPMPPTLALLTSLIALRDLRFDRTRSTICC